MKHYSTTVMAIPLNVIGQTINQSYILKRNVQPFYVNQHMSLVNIPQGRARISQRYETTLKVLQNLFSLTTAIRG